MAKKEHGPYYDEANDLDLKLAVANFEKIEQLEELGFAFDDAAVMSAAYVKQIGLIKEGRDLKNQTAVLIKILFDKDITDEAQLKKFDLSLIKRGFNDFLAQFGVLLN